MFKACRESKPKTRCQAVECIVEEFASAYEKVWSADVRIREGGTNEQAGASWVGIQKLTREMVMPDLDTALAQAGVVKLALTGFNAQGCDAAATCLQPAREFLDKFTAQIEKEKDQLQLALPLCTHFPAGSGPNPAQMGCYKPFEKAAVLQDQARAMTAAQLLQPDRCPTLPVNASCDRIKPQLDLVKQSYRQFLDAAQRAVGRYQDDQDYWCPRYPGSDPIGHACVTCTGRLRVAVQTLANFVAHQGTILRVMPLPPDLNSVVMKATSDVKTADNRLTSSDKGEEGRYGADWALATETLDEAVRDLRNTLTGMEGQAEACVDKL